MKTLLYINGEWTGEELEVFPVKNPATGEIIDYVPNAGENEAKMAIDAASSAFLTWSKTTAKERSGYLRKLYDLIMEEKEELALIMTKEMGKPIREARGEVDYAASFIEWYAEEAKRVYGETIPAKRVNQRMFVIKQPVGVVAAITPWNFPAAMITRKLAPALAAGCTFVVKPAESTPLTALKIMELCEKAGIPKGVVNLVVGQAEQIGRAFMESQKVRKLTFTGSTKVGKYLMEQASHTVKRLSLELGGHAPFLVFNDANLDLAIEGALASKYRNSGQTCICANRFYVQEEIYETFVKKFSEKVSQLKIGNGMDEKTEVGPLINEDGYKKVEHQVKDALHKGAICEVGGEGMIDKTKETYFYKPTVLKNVTSDMVVMHEETFGPVAPIQKFKTAKEAIQLANETNFGLAAYVYTNDVSQGVMVSEQLEYGIVGWNDGVPSTAEAPFGGMKESGLGREGSHFGIDEYVEIKYVSLGLTR